jgi:arginine/ornithine N-succinyltransferase beta subunit
LQNVTQKEPHPNQLEDFPMSNKQGSSALMLAQEAQLDQNFSIELLANDLSKLSDAIALFLESDWTPDNAERILQKLNQIVDIYS